MNAFTIISCLILYGLTFLCFFIPFKSGQKTTGKIVGLTLGILIILTLIGNLDFLVIFICPIFIIFQLIFITYWTFRYFGKKTAGRIATILLTIAFLLLILSPWISDWTFSKKDVKKILSYHSIELKDDFKIIRNEAGGFRDYYETFTLKLSDKDFENISQAIKKSKNYKGFFNDYSNLPSANYKTFDTIDFETPNQFNREYWTDKKMENGTYHFRIQLNKQSKELSYIGSDE
ncbi:hypothetical protein EGI11_00025 [Chryseobacterium sp. H3056]|uniref:Uncharacterized protein n=1 Tax=Kaistella daneshvariae TaxID=2487074 RepID=A0A3N0WYY6_9FLAO|nr:hypothetical protein [Kaistella daneshvariae]ROI10336.1 hypothetical protein EGI11_00025 [Kaistella daneshvariae]